MTSHNGQQKNAVKKSSSSLIPRHVAEEMQDNAIIEDWLAERLTNKFGKHQWLHRKLAYLICCIEIPLKRVRMLYRKKWVLYPENT